MKCPTCNHDIDYGPGGASPEPAHDNEADGLIKCADCKGSGDDPVRPGTACAACDGSGWV